MAFPRSFATVLRTVAAAAVAAVLPLGAQITLTCPQTRIHSGEHCTFTAGHPDGEPGVWAWTVLEPDGGSLVAGPGGRADYTPPKVTAPRTFHVQVWEDVHPPRVAIQEIQVLPQSDLALKNLQASDWMVPKLEIYAGEPEPAPEAATARFSGLRKIVYLDDPALPGHLNRHWVVADDYGLQLVSSRGEVRPWLGGRERPAIGRELPADLADPEAFLCTGLAVRPPGSPESNPLHLVFCEVSLHPRYACRVYSLEPGGGRRLLTGGAGTGCQDGPAAEAQFGAIGDLALDRSGNLFLLDRGNGLVRRLSPDGKVTTVAGHRPSGAPESRDGLGAEAAFLEPSGMVLDPATGDLYVADANAIRRVTPAGQVTTILGLARAPGAPGGFALPTEDAFAQVPAGTNCLDHPEGLAIQGRNLYIADSGNCALRVLDLDLGTLHTVAGTPLERRTRRGPLAYYSPGRSAADCAALATPHCVTFNAEGTCLMGTAECIVALDMPPFLAPGRLARRAQPEAPKEDPRERPAPLPGAPSPVLPPQGLLAATAAPEAKLSPRPDPVAANRPTAPGALPGSDALAGPEAP